MPNYSKSFIYKLECKDPKVTEIYVGATTDFYNRKSRHKRCCINKDGKPTGNFPVYCFMRKHGSWDNWNMLVIEEVNARNKRHLNQIEAKYIRELKAELNSVIPQDIDGGLGKKEYQKEYHKINREKLADNRKEYREKNAEKIAEYHKKWHERNREKVTEKNKIYRENNREKIAEQKKEKVKCGCGLEITKNHLSRHKHSQKHQDWVNRPEPNLIFVD